VRSALTWVVLSIAIGVSIVSRNHHTADDSIHISVPYEPDTLDPHARARLSNFAMVFNFYESLVTADSSMRIQPCLATRWENPDVYTWIFHLNTNVRFHSGKKLTSDDVVYSFERLMKTKNLEASSFLTNISEVTAIDPATVQIRTTRPLTIFLNKVFFIVIIPKGATDLDDHVDGTGPYKLLRWTKGQSIELIRNDHYWGKKPALRKVTFYLSRSPEEALQDLLNGRSEFIQCNSRKIEQQVNKEKYETFTRDSLFVKYLSYDMFRSVTPYCNAKSNPFQNELVRRAIYMAIDRKSLVNALPSFAIPALQPVPPFVFGYNARIGAPKYDPAAARKLLSDAGYPNGFSVTLHSRQLMQETGTIVQKQLAQIGIRVTLKILPDSQFFDSINHRDFSFFLSRLGATIGDLSDLLDGAMHSGNTENHYGALNYSGYNNPDVDRIAEDSAGIQSMDERRVALENAMAIIMKDLPWVPLCVDQDVYVIDKAYTWQPRLDSHILASEIKMARD
jgi:peptide/nickel transport system substrate-binding protein